MSVGTRTCAGCGKNEMLCTCPHGPYQEVDGFGGIKMPPMEKLSPMTPEDRYRNDPTFAAIVNALYDGIVKMRYTPTEVRDAAMLASIKYEMNHVRPNFDVFREPPQ